MANTLRVSDRIAVAARVRLAAVAGLTCLASAGALSAQADSPPAKPMLNGM
jgi:hypothetical protein